MPDSPLYRDQLRLAPKTPPKEGQEWGRAKVFFSGATFFMHQKSCSQPCREKKMKRSSSVRKHSPICRLTSSDGAFHTSCCLTEPPSLPRFFTKLQHVQSWTEIYIKDILYSTFQDQIFTKVSLFTLKTPPQAPPYLNHLVKDLQSQ